MRDLVKYEKPKGRGKAALFNDGPRCIETMTVVPGAPEQLNIHNEYKGDLGVQGVYYVAQRIVDQILSGDVSEIILMGRVK